MQIFADKKFENAVDVIKAFDNESFYLAFKEIEKYRKTHYLVGYVRYEAKEIFLGKKIESKFPLLYFEVYSDFSQFSPSFIVNDVEISIAPKLDFEEYKKAIDKIMQEIAEGNTYEVNYTYDWDVKTNLCGFDLYAALLSSQKTPYNAFIKNEWEEILSFSPELFFELNGGKIFTKPMKGTVKRGETPEEDEENIIFLKNDIKNRAENVMIVDLLRNDLGKIAKTGSVNVDKLFEIETHKTLHQMTSEVSAELDENVTLYDIFEAIFPCGSITGAPKISTMEIIDSVEKGKRDVYCGAIGLISPEKTVFSVPIRILQKKYAEEYYTYRVGGAIVWDSSAVDEWEETFTKIKFLRDYETKSAKLIETILVENGELKYKNEHLERMRQSAIKLGYVFCEEKINDATSTIDSNDAIFRLLLSKNGELEVQLKELLPLESNFVTVSNELMNSFEPFLLHKTTFRPWYEKSMQKIAKGEVFDELYFNEKGELTEGARSNVILQLRGELFTPPIECGLLNGVLRTKILEKSSFGEPVKEKILYINDLRRAEKVFCINSIRGIVEVKLDFNR